MPLTPDDVSAVADAVVERLRALLPPAGWPEGRGCLSEPEAATYLAIGSDYLRELRQEGRISYTAQGRRVTYSPHDVTDYLERCRRGAGGDVRPASEREDMELRRAAR